MTIAAGVLCGDGIVLCADTEITMPTTKGSGNKLFHGGDQENVSIAMAGAGDVDMFHYAVQRIGPVDISPLRSHEEFRSVVEKAVSRIYAKHIWPSPSADQLDFTLLIGYWTRGEGWTLFKTSCGACLAVDSFTVVGSGADIGNHVLGRMFTDNMSVRQAVPACVQTVREGKRAHYVGGDTHIIVLQSDGRLVTIGGRQIRDYERVFDEITWRTTVLSLMACDLRIHQDDLTRTMDDFAVHLKAVRSEEFKQEQLAEWAEEGRIGDTPSQALSAFVSDAASKSTNSSRDQT